MWRVPPTTAAQPAAILIDMADDPRPADGDDRRPGGDGPLRHPIHAAEREIEHLHDIASEGESPATPAILIGTWVAAVVPLVAIVIALAFTIAYLVTRGGSESPTTPAPTTTVTTQRTATAGTGGSRSRSDEAAIVSAALPVPDGRSTGPVVR
jgi:hypothetical protein